MLKSPIPEDISNFKKSFDVLFEVFLKEKVLSLQKKLGATRVNQLLEYIYVLSSSGKRFRPYLVYSAYIEYGGKKDITHFLFGIELLHIFALVHDDIMDNANTRHGKETANKKYQEYYIRDKSHTALSQAILLGDLLFSFAEECFLQNDSNITTKNKLNAQKEYRTLVNEVIYGQMLDIDMTEVFPTDKKLIYKKMALKSGRYSIMRPLLIGAKLAGANNNNLDFLSEYGEHLGIAFQIQDDLLDCSATSTNFGKKLYGDLQTSQQTYISFYMLNKSTELERETFLKFFGRKKIYSKNEKLAIEYLLSNSGALIFTQREINKHFKQAEEALYKYSEKNTNLWLHILEILRGRKK